MRSSGGGLFGARLLPGRAGGNFAQRELPFRAANCAAAAIQVQDQRIPAEDVRATAPNSLAAGGGRLPPVAGGARADPVGQRTARETAGPGAAEKNWPLSDELRVDCFGKWWGVSMRGRISQRFYV